MRDSRMYSDMMFSAGKLNGMIYPGFVKMNRARPTRKSFPAEHKKPAHSLKINIIDLKET